MLLRNAFLILMFAALFACSGSPPPIDAAQAAQVAASARDAKASKDLALYEQMRSANKNDLAAQLGKELLAKYPESTAAAKVKESIEQVNNGAQAEKEAQRIARLWTYNTAPEAGGSQYSAYVYAKDEVSAGGKTQRLRLVLRQHPSWGQSVYLLLESGGFRCGADCSASVRFDDQPAQRMAMTIPPTGEPAIFIDDNKGFIAKLAKARWLHIDAQLKGASAKHVVSFEVAGFDAARMPNKPH
ncbi:hypothetical protein ELE36_01790 [Pseudolysobacter antarcticus]|uniref:Lipoprotein n=1 Tax=Pseudolysobacter antarcticus TaxID=2511995 RepID=A0A411HFG5_9GAMM|nr:hypothetical protein [Pseudolysobacter antarcticus]QBB69209.1 hypothetical protein ELE36_01790 [Pseudolysobacter antarcticus]